MIRNDQPRQHWARTCTGRLLLQRPRQSRCSADHATELLSAGAHAEPAEPRVKRWIIARWLLRDLLLGLSALLLVLLLTSLGGRVLGFLAQAAAGQLTPAMLVAIVIYRIPLYLQLVLPLALFLVVMLTLGRGFAERELLIAQAAGWTPLRITRLLLLFAALPVVCACVLSFWATPYAQRSLTDQLDM